MGEVGSDSVNTQVSALKGRQDGTGGEAILRRHFNFLVPSPLAGSEVWKGGREGSHCLQDFAARSAGASSGRDRGSRKERLSGRASQGFPGNALLISD